GPRRSPAGWAGGPAGGWGAAGWSTRGGTGAGRDRYRWGSARLGESRRAADRPDRVGREPLLGRRGAPGAPSGGGGPLGAARGLGGVPRPSGGKGPSCPLLPGRP